MWATLAPNFENKTPLYMSQRKYSRDLMRDAEFNRAQLNNHLDTMQREEDFAAAKRFFWVMVASIVAIGITYNYFLNG